MLIYDCKITNITRAYLEAPHDSNLANYIENRLPQDIKRIFNVLKMGCCSCMCVDGQGAELLPAYSQDENVSLLSKM